MSIESDGITAFRILIAQSKLLVLYAKENDKYPVWDGEIFMYSIPEHNGKNEFIKGLVPIQIKSTKVDSLANISRKYSIEYSDLEIYYKGGGVLFLRPTFVTPVEYRIFHKLLLPVEINDLLNQKKFPDKKSISIELLEIENIELLEQICNLFIENQKSKFNFLIDNQNLAETLKENPKLTLKTISKPNIKDAIFSDYASIYIETKEGIQIPTNLKIEEFSSIINSVVKINDKIYFTEVKNIFNKKDEIIFYFNTALKLELKDNHLYFKLKQEEDVLFDDLLIGNEFLDELEITGNFSIDNELFPSPISVESEKNQKQFDYLKKIDQMLKFFKVDTKKLKFKDLIPQKDLIDKFVSLFIENQFTEIENSSSTHEFFIHDLINRKVLLIFVKNDSGTFKAYNYCSETFDKNCNIQKKDENMTIPCSRFIALLTIPKFNKEYEVFEGYFDLIEEDLLKFYQPMDKVKEFYSLLMLDLIKEFDKRKKDEYLSLAEKINELIYTPEEKKVKLIYIINMLQIQKRKSKLNQDALNQLIKMKSESDDKNLICCANILLESFNEFEILFSSFKEDKKNIFMNWPIWNLFLERKKRN